MVDPRRIRFEGTSVNHDLLFEENSDIFWIFDRPISGWTDEENPEERHISNQMPNGQPASQSLGMETLPKMVSHPFWEGTTDKGEQDESIHWLLKSHFLGDDKNYNNIWTSYRKPLIRRANPDFLESSPLIPHAKLFARLWIGVVVVVVAVNPNLMWHENNCKTWMVKIGISVILGNKFPFRKWKCSSGGGGRAGNVLFLPKLLVIINSLNFMCLLFRTFPYTNFVLS